MDAPQDFERWLFELLANEPRPISEIKRAAQNHGWSSWRLKKTRRKLPVITEEFAASDGSRVSWRWRLKE